MQDAVKGKQEVTASFRRGRWREMPHTFLITTACVSCSEGDHLEAVGGGGGDEGGVIVLCI